VFFPPVLLVSWPRPRAKSRESASYSTRDKHTRSPIERLSSKQDGNAPKRSSPLASTLARNARHAGVSFQVLLGERDGVRARGFHTCRGHPPYDTLAYNTCPPRRAPYFSPVRFHPSVRSFIPRPFAPRERWRPGSNADQMRSSSAAREDTQIARGMVHDSTFANAAISYVPQFPNSLVRATLRVETRISRSLRAAVPKLAIVIMLADVETSTARSCMSDRSRFIVFYQFARFIKLLNIAFKRRAETQRLSRVVRRFAYNIYGYSCLSLILCSLFLSLKSSF